MCITWLFMTLWRGDLCDHFVLPMSLLISISYHGCFQCSGNSFCRQVLWPLYLCDWVNKFMCVSSNLSFQIIIWTPQNVMSFNCTFMVHAVHQVMAVICFKNKQRITRSITTSKLTYTFCFSYQKLKTDNTVIQVEWWAETNSYPFQNQRQICNCSVNNRKKFNIQV